MYWGRHSGVDCGLNLAFLDNHRSGNPVLWNTTAKDESLPLFGHRTRNVEKPRFRKHTSSRTRHISAMPTLVNFWSTPLPNLSIDIIVARNFFSSSIFFPLRCLPLTPSSRDYPRDIFSVQRFDTRSRPRDLKNLVDGDQKSRSQDYFTPRSNRNIRHHSLRTASSPFSSFDHLPPTQYLRLIHHHPTTVNNGRNANRHL